MVVVAQDVSGMARGHRHLPLSRTAAGDGSASPGRFALTTAAKVHILDFSERGQGRKTEFVEAWDFMGIKPKNSSCNHGLQQL